MLFKIARNISLSVHRAKAHKMELKTSLFLIFALVLKFYFGFTTLEVILTVIVIYLATGGWKFTWIIIKTLPRDMK